MDLRRTKLIQEFRDAREDLLNINFATDTTNRIGVSRPFALIDAWFIKWSATFKKHYTFVRQGLDTYYFIHRQLDGYGQENDPEIFNEFIPLFVEAIDQGIKLLDKTYVVKPVLEDYITRVKDTKLAELLKEFNLAQNTAPNLAAIGFRTILCLIIQEKAKRVNPTSNTATRANLAPTMINSAKSEGILSGDEQRLVDSFVSTHKDIYDFVAHRPGRIIDKNEVDTMVDLLNKLLPSIIN